MYLRCKICNLLYEGHSRENISIGIKKLKEYIESLDLDDDLNIFGKIYEIEDFEKCYICGNLYTNMKLDYKKSSDKNIKPIINFYDD
jgi:hypothetical protein